MKNITINYESNTIDVSKEFLKKAKEFDSPEYKELRRARAMEPTFKIQEASIKKSTSKKTYKKLTFKAMEAHIKHIETDENKRKKVLAEFTEIKAYADARSSNYPIVKKWFLSKYRESYLEILNEPEAESKESTSAVKEELNAIEEKIA